MYSVKVGLQRLWKAGYTVLSAIVATMCYVSRGDSWIVQQSMCLMHYITIEPLGDFVPGWLCYIVKCFS